MWVLDNQVPSYLKDLVVPFHLNRALHSQTAGLLVVSKMFKSRMGGLQLSAPLLSNQVLLCIWTMETLPSFKLWL